MPYHDSKNVAYARTAARVDRLMTASLSEARKRYTASIARKARFATGRDEGAGPWVGDGLITVVAMMMHLTARGSSREGSGAGVVGPIVVARSD